MANMWDNLTPEQKTQMARQMMVGSQQSNENLNRAMQALSQNPQKVEEMAEELGMTDHNAELEDTDPDAEETAVEEGNDIERNVSESLAEDNNVQETGEVSPQGDIPPPEEGESIEQYMQRLAMLQQRASGGR